MSHIEGLDAIGEKLSLFGKAVEEKVYANIEAEVRACQLEAANLVPVDTGQGRSVLLLPEAIDSGARKADGSKYWVFGFLTKRMRAKKEDGGALHLWFVEFGTKHHDQGEEIVRPHKFKRSKHGRITKGQRRRKRGSPPRPAQPFFRPAVANLFVRLREQRNFQNAVTAAKELAGFVMRGNS